jgi:hypothetical protein
LRTRLAARGTGTDGKTEIDAGLDERFRGLQCTTGRAPFRDNLRKSQQRFMCA